MDAGQLENALINLAINARDVMSQGGQLIIETANTRFNQNDILTAGADPGDYVQLTVTDNGTGMSPDILKNVFEPFYTTKEVGAGSGLGLSMVYGFVKQSGGHIFIASTLGEGTVIKILLPRSEKTGSLTGELWDDQALGSTGETILLVEDDPDVRELISAMLESLGYSVIEAETPSAALKKLDLNIGADLLLTDVILPGGINGYELSQHLKHQFPDLKVLYISGYTEDAIMTHGNVDPGVKLLQKPFRKIDLSRAIRKTIDSSAV